MHMLPKEQLDSIKDATKNTKRDGNSHLKHLLTSICHSLAKNDVVAINDLHKYFDYNMRQK
jgi:nucleoid DNA-binding protein